MFFSIWTSKSTKHVEQGLMGFLYNAVVLLYFGQTQMEYDKNIWNMMSWSCFTTHLPVTLLYFGETPIEHDTVYGIPSQLANHSLIKTV